MGWLQRAVAGLCGAIGLTATLSFKKPGTLEGRATNSQVGKLGREEPLGTEATVRGSIDTLRISDAGDTQSRVVKIASGGGAMAFPRSCRRNPRELKTQEGNEWRAK